MSETNSTESGNVAPARPADFLEWLDHLNGQNEVAGVPHLGTDGHEKMLALAEAIRRHGDAAAVSATIEAADRAVDLLATSGMGTARVLGLEAPDVPRLLVSASCRMLERLVEAYASRMERVSSGKLAWDLADRGRRREEILAAATDLRKALEGGLEMVNQIGASLTAKGVTQ